MKNKRAGKGSFFLGRYFRNGENMVGHLSNKTTRLALFLEKKAYLDKKRNEKEDKR